MTQEERLALELAHVKFGVPVDVKSSRKGGWYLRKQSFVGSTFSTGSIYRLHKTEETTK